MYKKTLVLGASLKADRYSNLAIHRLVGSAIAVVAIGLREGSVAGVPIEVGMPKFKGVDTVTLYLNAKRQAAYYDYIISLQPKRVIFNPGTENETFENVLQENSIETEVACTLTLIATKQY